MERTKNALRFKPHQRPSGLVIIVHSFYTMDRFYHRMHRPRRWAGEEIFDAAKRLDCATAVSGRRGFEMSRKEKPSGEVALAPDGVEDTLGRDFLGVSVHISKLVPFRQDLRAHEFRKEF